MMRAWMLALLVACGSGEAPETPEADAAEATAKAPSTPAEFAEVAKAIADAPENKAAILAEHGLTEDSWAQAMFDIAADAEQAKAYADAYGG